MGFASEFARFLHKEGIIRYGDFTLSSGRPSPYYVDLRMVPSYPVQFRLLVKQMQKLVSGAVGLDSFGPLASVPTGGLVVASALAAETVKPLVYVRPSPKVHGTSKSVEGRIRDGERAVMIDDVATTGGSVMRAVEQLRKEGAVVEDAFVVLDRLEGAAKSLQDVGVRLRALTDISEITSELASAGLVGGAELDAVRRRTV